KEMDVGDVGNDVPWSIAYVGYPMHGIDTLLVLKKTKPNLRFIIVTAFATVDNAVVAIKKGAHNYIVKPFQIDELVVKINTAIEEGKFHKKVNIEELDRVMAALSHPTRRQIVEMLDRGVSYKLSEMTKFVGFQDHTKILFHLRLLEEVGILSKTDTKLYCLTDSGKTVLDSLKELKNRLFSPC
ncbi:MAG: response regulator, partial [Magnetococcus sp. XQGC-1]